LELSLFNYENQKNEDMYIIMSLTNENNNFNLDIINEELFKSFFIDEQKVFQTSGILTNKKIIFIMTFWKKK